jgi:hypothetical protein
MISSFGDHLLLPFRKKGFTVGYLVGEETMARGARAFAMTLLRLRPQYLNLPVQLFDRLGLKAGRFFCGVLRALGFKLLFWTVNTEAEAALVSRYSRIMVTDEVEMVLAQR